MFYIGTTKQSDRPSVIANPSARDARGVTRSGRSNLSHAMDRLLRGRYWRPLAMTCIVLFGSLRVKPHPEVTLQLPRPSICVLFLAPIGAVYG